MNRRLFIGTGTVLVDRAPTCNENGMDLLVDGCGAAGEAIEDDLDVIELVCSCGGGVLGVIVDPLFVAAERCNLSGSPLPGNLLVVINSFQEERDVSADRVNIDRVDCGTVPMGLGGGGRFLRC